MKPPANVALSVSRDRASAGRILHQRAATSFPKATSALGPAPRRSAVPRFASTSTLPRFRASAPAPRPPVDLRVTFADRLRLERQGLGLGPIVAAVARAASGDRSPRPNLAERVRAGRMGAATVKPDARRVREALDRGRDDAARAAGDDAPARKGRLSVAELETLARDYAARHGCNIADARRAVERDAR